MGHDGQICQWPTGGIPSLQVIDIDQPGPPPMRLLAAPQCATFQSGVEMPDAATAWEPFQGLGNRNLRLGHGRRGARTRNVVDEGLLQFGEEFVRQRTHEHPSELG